MPIQKICNTHTFTPALHPHEVQGWNMLFYLHTHIYIIYRMPQTLFTLFMTFLQAGGLTIGDGYACITPLKKALVNKNGWMTDEEFAKHLTVVQAMPGIFNVNFATYMGRQIKGWQGSAVCLLGMLLPPLAIFCLFATFYNDFCQLPAIRAFLRGVRPAIIALVALPCIQLWRSSNVSLSTVWIPIGAAIAIGLLGISPSYIILGLTVLAAIYALFVYSNND